MRKCKCFMFSTVKVLALVCSLVVANASSLREGRTTTAEEGKEPSCVGYCRFDGQSENDAWDMSKRTAYAKWKVQSRESQYPSEEEELWTRRVRVGEDGKLEVIEERVFLNETTSNVPEHRELQGTWALTKERVFPYTAIGRLVLKFEEKTFFCTGTLVAENIILTAAHCVINSAGTLTTDVTFYANQMYSTTAESESDIVIGAYGHVTDNYLTYPDRDWMYLFLRKSMGQKYGWLSLSVPPDSVDTAQGVPVRVAGYGNDPTCESGQSLCEGSGSMIRTGSSPDEGAYTVATAGGSSGGPVYSYDLQKFKFTVVGIHVRASDSGIKFGILSSAFLPDLEKAKAKSFAQGEAEKFREGVVCLAHDHCDSFTFCSNRNGRCFRCDGCPVVTRAVDDVYPFDSGTCPEKCAGSPPNDEAKSALDIDVDNCLVGGTDNTFSSSVCEGSVCVDRSTCGIVSNPTDKSLYESFGGSSIPIRFVDIFSVSSKILNSFRADGKKLVLARGYKGGGVLSDGRVMGVGAVYTLEDNGVDQSTGDGSNQSKESSNGAGKVVGIVLLVLLMVVGAFLFTRRILQEKERKEELKSQALAIRHGNDGRLDTQQHERGDDSE